MKKVLIGLVLFLLLTQCSTSFNHYEDLKSFKPDDKYFTSSLKNLHFITEVSSIDKVDTTFKQIINGYNLPIDAKGCSDGTYTGESPYDAFNYQHVVKITIKDEKIVDVDYDEIHLDGHGKQSNVKYNEDMSVTGTSPSIAYPKYENQLMEKQNIMEMDAVSGATYSLYRFRQATMVAFIRALEEAKK